METKKILLRRIQTKRIDLLTKERQKNIIITNDIIDIAVKRGGDV